MISWALRDFFKTLLRAVVMTLKKSLSSSQKAFVLSLSKLIRAEAIDFGAGHVTNQSSEKCPRDISVLLEFFFRSSINYPWQDRRART